MAPESPAYPPPQRLRFPAAEGVQQWLPLLLDAYYIIDQGVAEAIRREEKQGRRLACAKGCSSCCKTHTTIPVYPLELVGMAWYATEHVQQPVRAKLGPQLRAPDLGGACPFLVEGVCAIHPMRPMACRQFNVFGQVCAAGEDAYYTRRKDVLNPIKRYTDQAFDATLPFYGITTRPQRRKAIKTGALHGTARVLRECEWQTLATKMEAFDAMQPPSPPLRP